VIVVLPTSESWFEYLAAFTVNSFDI